MCPSQGCESEEGKPSQHLLPFLDKAGEAMHGSSSSKAVASLLPCLTECAACQHVLGNCTRASADMIVASIADNANADPETWNDKAALQRKRADEDVKHHLAVTMVRQGFASSSTSCINAHTISKSTGRAWLTQAVCQHIGYCWKQLGENMYGVCSLLEDGARFGNPARETQIYCFWSADRDAGVWLPPQEPVTECGLHDSSRIPAIRISSLTSPVH